MYQTSQNFSKYSSFNEVLLIPQNSRMPLILKSPEQHASLETSFISQRQISSSKPNILLPNLSAQEHVISP